MRVNKPSPILGFSLVELLIVISIIGILATLAASGFLASQRRGRDAKRKSDFRQLANALELHFSDYGIYPAADIEGRILACPTPSGPCNWGTDEFTDGNTIYAKIVPSDPLSNQNYFYRLPLGSSAFQLFTRLESKSDRDCINGNCEDPVTHLCGTGEKDFCNFSITSPNVSPIE